MDAAFQRGEVEGWNALLKSHPSYIEQDRLLNHILLETNFNGTSEASKLACLKYLFESGAELYRGSFSNFVQIATTGNAELVELLIQYGADPNGIDEALTNRPILFEAIGGHGNTDAVINVLIDHGADADAKVFDIERQETLTPLLYAVYRERWSIASC